LGATGNAPGKPFQGLGKRQKGKRMNQKDLIDYKNLRFSNPKHLFKKLILWEALHINRASLFCEIHKNSKISAFRLDLTVPHDKYKDNLNGGNSFPRISKAWNLYEKLISETLQRRNIPHEIYQIVAKHKDGSSHIHVGIVTANAPYIDIQYFKDKWRQTLIKLNYAENDTDIQLCVADAESCRYKQLQGISAIIRYLRVNLDYIAGECRRRVNDSRLFKLLNSINLLDGAEHTINTMTNRERTKEGNNNWFTRQNLNQYLLKEGFMENSS
jgi:hypothetical protein